MASDNPDAVLIAAAGMTERGLLEEAEDLCAKVLRTWGNSPGAYNQIGVIRYAQKRLHEACTYFKTAYSLEEGNVDAGKNLADVLLELGSVHEALQTYRNLQKCFPEDAEIVRGLEGAARKTGTGFGSGTRDSEVQVAESRVSSFTFPDLCLLEGRKSGMSGHLHFLYNQVREIRAINVIEISLGGGNSSMPFLLALKETGGMLTSIDIRPCDEARRYLDLLPETVNWRFLRTRSDEAVARQRESDPRDVLLIDGFHSYDQCRSDYFNYSPLVRQGGYILFHDSSTIQGVMDFTSELLARGLGGTNLDYCNGLFVFQNKTEVIW